MTSSKAATQLVRRTLTAAQVQFARVTSTPDDGAGCVTTTVRLPEPVNQVQAEEAMDILGGLPGASGTHRDGRDLVVWLT